MEQMNLVKEARAGNITAHLQEVSKKEGVNEEFLAERVAEGKVVIPANILRNNIDPAGIGTGLSTKVNANIGTSPRKLDIGGEMEKANVAVKAGADTLMDLSSGGDIRRMRRELLSEIKVPLGTVPIYQAGLKALHERGAVVEMTGEDMFQAIEEQVEEGIDFITVHCGVNMDIVSRINQNQRIIDVASRGGSFLWAWIMKNEKENPLYAEFDRLLDIALAYDVTLSLGDGMRPGSIVDATDGPQVQELVILGELVKRAREAGVQVIVEGPGHVPLDQVASNILLQKRICQEVPFYILGPLVTDSAAGYDHISAAIGGAVGASAGADFLCYVTPAEHISLPDAEQVKEGVVASKIAAHAGDIARGLPAALERDRQMSLARKELNWEEMRKCALDPQAMENAMKKEGLGVGDECSMCGEYCAVKIVNECHKGKISTGGN